MRNGNRLWTQFAPYAIAASCSVLALSGCGKKSSKGSGSEPTAPTILANASASAVDKQEGNIHRITATSPIAGASLKCMIVVDQQASEWKDCPATGEDVVTEAGRRYEYKVKSISGGIESSSYTLAFAGGAPTSTDSKSPNPVAPTSASNLQTIILNKSEVGSIYEKSSLTLQLGIAGGAVSIEEVRFDCKLETDPDFKLCPGSENSVTLDQLRDGANYSLRIRAVVRKTQVPAMEDSIAFSVKMAVPSSGIVISGTDALEANVGVASLNFQYQGVQSFRCKIDAEMPIDCSRGMPLDLDQMDSGSHSLKVDAIDQSGAIVSTQIIPFCSQFCPGAGGQDPTKALQPSFLLGGTYTAQVPYGMHVQQYSSDTNTNSALDFYRVSPASDPYAIGNDACVGVWDKKMSGRSASGKIFNYCNSTNSHVVQNYVLERRFANNHLQLATDPDLIRQNPRSQEVILFNMYKDISESFYTQSRFTTLCANGISGFKGLSPVRKSENPIPLAQGFFGYDWKYSDLWTCDVMLSGSGPDWGQPQLWKIGAFYIVDQNAPFPDYSCNCGNYPGRKSMLEVIYMTRNYQPDAFFAVDAKNLITRATLLKSEHP